MSQRIDKAIAELAEALTEKYGVVPYQSKRDISIRVGEVDTTPIDSDVRYFIYTIDIDVETVEVDKY